MSEEKVNEVEEIHNSDENFSDQIQDSNQKEETKKFYNIKENGLPFKKKLGESVVNLVAISKGYTIQGRTESVQALKHIDLNDEAEFYSIKRGEFVMVRGPSGGGKTFKNQI
jgi:ABC-type glutathione transport system ATPase component